MFSTNQKSSEHRTGTCAHCQLLLFVLYVWVWGGVSTALVDFNWPVLNVLHNCSCYPLDGFVSESVFRYQCSYTESLSQWCGVDSVVCHARHVSNKALQTSSCDIKPFFVWRRFRCHACIFDPAYFLIHSGCHTWIKYNDLSVQVDFLSIKIFIQCDWPRHIFLFLLNLSTVKINLIIITLF